MKLSCSDFTGGWSSAPSSPSLGFEAAEEAAAAMRPAWSSEGELRAAAPVAIEDDDLGVEPDLPSTATLTRSSHPPSAEALGDALGPLFDRTDEVPALPFLLETPLDMKGLVGVAS